MQSLNNNCKSYEIRYSRYSKSNNANEKDLILNSENENLFAIKLILNNKNKKRLTSNNENKISDKDFFLYSIFFIFYIYIFIFLIFCVNEI